MGNTIHQMRIDLMTDTALSSLFLLCAAARNTRLIDRGCTAQCLFHQFTGAIDAVCHLRHHHPSASKTVHGNFRICRHDDPVGTGNILCRQYVFGAAGASCLHLDIISQFFRLLFQRLCRHISMSDPCGTARHRHKPLALPGFLSRCCPFLLPAALCLINDLKKFLYILCPAETPGKLFIHQQDRKLTQYIQMYIILCIWRGNQEKQCRRFTVQRIEINSIRQRHGSQPRSHHRIGLAMGNGDSLSDSRRALFLSGIDPPAVFLHILHPAAPGH